VELTVLGSGGTWPEAGGATSGYLVRSDGFNLWMDAGTGTLSRLQQHIPISEIHAVLISHAHPDHFVDLYPTFYARHYAALGTHGLPLYAPPGFFGHVSHLISDDSRDKMGVAFDVNELVPEKTVEIGPFRVQARLMQHIGVIAMGFRIEDGAGVLAYTGDSGPTAELVELARGADVLVSEATWQDHMDLLPFHMSARQAAEHATAAGAGGLILTHIWPSLDHELSREQASATYDGPIELAAEGMNRVIGG